tara:strand:+ start:338 stop:1009 length:672 start_codon:yes stop_codon:yes gene_type:complete
MNKFFASLSLIIILNSCSNSPETETGEIRTLQLLKMAYDTSSKPKRFIDARNLINREQIDAANIPVLFVELASGQNGTLTPYPGQGVGQTWLGADGATITLERGILKASRGMGNDLMGASTSMPSWSQIDKKTESYSRKLSYLTGNNKISKRFFSCVIEKTSNDAQIEIWDIAFKVDKFEENCSDGRLTLKNNYQVDSQGIIRRSKQYHSETLGSILIERLDR